MQINDDTLFQYVIRFAGWVAALVSTSFLGLAWYIWRGDRERIRQLEIKVNSAITKPEVETIVKRVEDHFHGEHKSILLALDRRHDELGKRHNELREDIGQLRDVVMRAISSSRWDGRDRRGGE